MRKISIKNTTIGNNHPMYIIAEIGVSPGKSLDQAKKMIKIASEAGANSVKFQTFTPHLLASEKARAAKHFRGKKIVEIYRKMEFPREYYQDVIEYAKKQKLTFLTSVFDKNSLDFLNNFEIPAFKIASFELHDFFLLDAVSETKKPIIISTGMANLSDIDVAINRMEKRGCTQIIILQTVSSYPARIEDYNLKVIDTLKNSFGYPVGISDHTSCLDLPIMAVMRHANLIEKHITLDNNGPNPDDFFALEPEKFKMMIQKIKTAEKALGDGRKNITNSELSIYNSLRLAIVSKKKIKKGERITNQNVIFKRAGYGIKPKYLVKILNCKLNVGLDIDEPIEWKHLLNKN